MDSIGWFIATLHELIGHDKTAMVIGMPIGDKRLCVLCQYEQNPNDITRRKVINALKAEL